MERNLESQVKDWVYFVGPNHLQNELLVSSLQAGQDPDLIYAYRSEMPVVPENGHTGETLVLLDCQNNEPFGETGLLGRLLPTHSFAECLVGLFNVPPRTGREEDFLKCGVRGIFASNCSFESFRKGIPAMLAGELWYPRKTLAACALKNFRRKNAYKKKSVVLTSREREILQKLESGASNKHIADDLFISPHTVKTHLYNIFRKIEVKNRLEASLWALENL